MIIKERQENGNDTNPGRHGHYHHSGLETAIGDATMQHVFRKFGLAWAAHGRISSTYVQYLEGKYTELRISELIAAQ